MDYLPLFFDLRGRWCLLVGGGTIALRKARLLTRAGARVRVVAPVISGELANLALRHQGELIYAEYDSAHLLDVTLVVSATDNETVNRAVASDCRQRQLPVNVVDNPQLCSVIMPAIVDRNPLIIAVSSGGEAPVLARMLRAKLEAWVPASWGRVAALASRYRNSAKQVFADTEQRRRFWEAVLDGPVTEAVLAGNEAEAERQLQQQLASGEVASGGEVYLVGAGPGDPDLLTFKALRLMQKAEVVLYDRLVSGAILDMVRRDAERIYVGKRSAAHSLPQPEINQLMLDLARQGKRVLRLKGGDPFIFGRGGEEIELLARHRIPFQVVPGITAASGCACYAGIPLTHRDYAQSVRFATGHLKDSSQDLNWQEFLSDDQTLVFYMGLGGLRHISERLIAHGKKPSTPAALIEQGTTSAQRVHVGTLATLADQIEQLDIQAPTLIIIGGVVELHTRLRWFNATEAPKHVALWAEKQ